MKKEVIAHKDPKSPVSEVFRTLRTNIQFMNTKNKLKSLLITSTTPSEGKSWVSANLAVTFAQAGKRVILVDADMRKGRQYNIFGVSPRPGLSNYLSGVNDINGGESSKDLADYIQETEIENLYLIAAGNIPPNPSELLISPQMVSLLDELKDLCDIVIIDGTPSELVTDSLILARLVDSTVIVTAHKQTKKESLKRIVTNIQNIGGKIAGVVVNKVPMSQKKYEQSYYYGSTGTRNIKSQSRPIKASSAKQAKIEEMKKRVATEANSVYRNEINNKTSNITLERKDSKIEDTEQEKNQQYKEQISEQFEEIPKALQSNIKIENSEEISLEKTNDILKQINDYLDQEKKKLN